ncbi:MAG: hypothetical protein PHH71_03565 [Clostridia bacterium]|nr:hypothetical protein [Clostridia bacterium]MDD3232191.1 hypothetical protein [Clostridia bacterium]
MFLYDGSFAQSDVDFVSAQIKFYQAYRIYRLKSMTNAENEQASSKNNRSIIQEREEQAYANALQNFLDVVTRGAIKGQVESMEFYCRFFPPEQTFDNTIFQNFRMLQNKGNRKPREDMALYAYYAWHALKGAVNLDADTEYEENIQNSNDYSTARRYYNESIEGLLSVAQRNILAKEYIIEKSLQCGPLASRIMCDFENEPIVQIDARPEKLYPSLNNFRNVMTKALQSQTNDDLRYKIQCALNSNFILFLPLDNDGQRTYERICPEISNFLKEIQRKQNTVSKTKDI